MARPAALLAACLCALLPACAGEPEPDWPAGSVVTGDARTLVRILEQLQGWEGTPLARRASALAERLAACEGFAARAPAGALGELLADVQCGEPTDLPAGLGRLRGEGDLAFVLRPGPDVRIAGRLRSRADGSLEVEARMVGEAPTGVAALAWAGDAPAGPPRLGAEGALVHARVRPAAGLDLATLVPEGGQGDRLFRLKSELFAGAVLGGVWELAVYLPPEGRMMPLMALGLDVASRRLAVAAMERFVEDVTSTWSVERAPFAAGGHEGGCLPRLNLMPELAPCYVATGDQLVVGWNPESVRQALAGGGDTALGDAGGLVVHLGRFGEADRRLRDAHAPGTPPARIDYAWRRLLARTRKDGDGMWVHVDLAAPAAAPVGAGPRARTAARKGP